MRLSVVVFLLMSGGILKAANDNLPVGARSAGMAHASICVNDVWAVQHNQAALANLKKQEVGVFSQIVYPNSKVLMNAVAVASPFKYGVISGTFTRLGFKNLFT